MKQKSLLTLFFSFWVLLTLQAQQKIVKGKIIDGATNEALPNVSILEQIDFFVADPANLLR